MHSPSLLSLSLPLPLPITCTANPVSDCVNRSLRPINCPVSIRTVASSPLLSSASPSAPPLRKFGGSRTLLCPRLSRARCRTISNPTTSVVLLAPADLAPCPPPKSSLRRASSLFAAAVRARLGGITTIERSRSPCRSPILRECLSLGLGVLERRVPLRPPSPGELCVLPTRPERPVPADCSMVRSSSIDRTRNLRRKISGVGLQRRGEGRWV